MLTYWSQGQRKQNFGDTLTVPLSTLFEPEFQTFMRETPECRFHLLGSVLCQFWIDEARRTDQSAVFWGCGYRGEAFVFDESKVRICGVRGRLTEQALHGKYPTIGDPGLLLPLIYPAESIPRHGRAILVPHFLDPWLHDAPTTSASSEVEIVSPVITEAAGVRALTQQIAGASFVWAGSLHAAIAALSYGVPFAFFKSGPEGFVDCPIKWADFCSAHGIQPVFFNGLAAARRWYDSIENEIRYASLATMLAHAPGPVRPAIIDQAAKYDRQKRARGDWLL